MNANALVVIADDDESVRRSLSRLARSAGLNVVAFGSARPLLGFSPPERPACLVLDLRMPDLNGLDLQRQLQEKGHDFPIIFISGCGDVPAVASAMKAGAIDFIPKPIDPKGFLTVIRQALERDRKQEAHRSHRKAVQQRMDTLTPREREVMELVVQGLPNKNIATQLGTAVKTIKVHRARVMEKMHAESLPDLVRMAQETAAGALMGGPQDPSAAAGEAMRLVS